MTHPAWKRSYAKKAARLRRQLTRKALAARLGVSVRQLDWWIKPQKAAHK